MPTPLIVNYTPTGMLPQKSDTPHVPIDPVEIVEDVHQAYETGITIVHLHGRDPGGTPTTSVDIYGRIVEGVRKNCPGLVVCVSLSGRMVTDPIERSRALELHPDMGSLTLSSLNFPRQASLNAPDTIKALIERMDNFGVKPELESFDLGMVNYANYLILKQLLRPPHYMNIILGNIAGAQPTLAHMASITAELPGEMHVAFGGIGRTQLTANNFAIALGYGVRIGLEDNIWFDERRTRLASNMDLLQRVHVLRELYERPLMTSQDFGSMGFYNTKVAEMMAS